MASPCNITSVLMMMMMMLQLLATCIIISISLSSPVAAVLPVLTAPRNASSTVTFLALGDWGRQGAYNQSLVARQMGVTGARLRIQFVISTGDNFYKDGLKDANDPLFLKSFTNIYTAKCLQVPWYTILGNHDYHGNAEAQLSPLLKKHDKRWHCMRSFIVKGGLVNIILFDTNPFVDRYFGRPEDSRAFNWTGVPPRQKYVSGILKDLKLALSRSRTVWKIVVGHHPIRSIGHNGDTPELVNQILPLLEAYKVHMYINGHDHCLQRISGPKSPIQFLTSGGGSRAWKGDFHCDRHKDSLKFYYDGQGFMSVRLTYTQAAVAFYDVSGKVLHRFKMFPR